ncbi:MAG: helix-turn-helix domain-containing GNAT family N-acetyltransferase [Gammaproteobacteria bacterium]|jgi:DNA-binding MarR family transcriptional regulator/GNAT superfamily N-acetyltransferase|nr:helix-turn-helix domain-containing GNAT family N-acetyltransferase [Gammaproteobacteria bacterium]MBU0786469.1 helix-turn-helix domain-containing GNAT family N-acetyltransferase [Gammaproteobacteria bacterium]MBU0816172.1 helix-turn-helix domain-containing GNAT family N-acetyltransferase [Gammaproteobacteria bacterium]MBU1787802.1 helix-turn-helix domain-containing GNAT family N-acetyltransferase [Gammaproteobacteria bacterium]
MSTMTPSPASVNPTPPSDTLTRAVRSFNRFYTQRIGVLSSYLGSDLSLTEARVLYELSGLDQPTASELGAILALDAGYLSRILRRFEKKGWLARVPSPADARQNLLALTPSGRALTDSLQKKSDQETAALLATMAPVAQHKLVSAMNEVQRLLTPANAPPATRTVVLRDPQPGDMGWVVQQHGEIYATEYGFNNAFEALVAELVARYLKNFQPDFEKCWIAELEGKRVGAVFVVRKSATVAQLRMLILTAEARGLGLGGRLTDECIAFARSKGYKKMSLWTNSCLDAARAIYARRGFQLTDSEPYSDFGCSLVSETWELRL